VNKRFIKVKDQGFSTFILGHFSRNYCVLGGNRLFPESTCFVQFLKDFSTKIKLFFQKLCRSLCCDCWLLNFLDRNLLTWRLNVSSWNSLLFIWGNMEPVVELVCFAVYFDRQGLNVYLVCLSSWSCCLDFYLLILRSCDDSSATS